MYKKSRTIDDISYRDVHELPQPSRNTGKDWFVHPGNFLWFLVFGWWMSILYLTVALVIFVVTPCTRFGRQYARLCFQMAGYILWPFGNFVEKIDFSTPAFGNLTHIDLPENDTVHSENEPLLNNSTFSASEPAPHRRRSWMTLASQQWKCLQTIGFSGLVFYSILTLILAPIHFIVSAICWFFVVSIPMAKLNFVLIQMLWRMPLSLHISSVRSLSTHPHVTGEILVCTYRAIALHYYKYTVDGINVIFINLLPVVIFALIDGYVIGHYWGHHGIADPLVVFSLSLLSVIPLAYYIGMAVASISSQSSFGKLLSFRDCDLRIRLTFYDKQCYFASINTH